MTTYQDLLRYEKINDILWFDWDPIGINDSDARDEYRSYAAEIFRLLKSGADKNELADKLYTIERETMGVNGNMNHCLAIAEKLLHT